MLMSVNHLRLVLGAGCNDPAALALGTVGRTVLADAIAVMDGDGHDRRANAVPNLALRIGSGGLNAGVDVLLDRRIGLGD